MTENETDLLSIMLQAKANVDKNNYFREFGMLLFQKMS